LYRVAQMITPYLRGGRAENVWPYPPQNACARHERRVNAPGLEDEGRRKSWRVRIEIPFDDYSCVHNTLRFLSVTQWK
jgi:hypothetical protein